MPKCISHDLELLFYIKKLKKYITRISWPEYQNYRNKNGDAGVHKNNRNSPSLPSFHSLFFQNPYLLSNQPVLVLDSQLSPKKKLFTVIK